MLIINGKIYTETRTIDSGYLQIKDDKIVAFGSMDHVVSDDVILDAKGKMIIPGFIDQHIHGAFGSDHMDATHDALHTITGFLPKEGTTSYLPTTMTQSVEAIDDALRAIVAYKQAHNEPGESEMLGIHLEGPFISPHHVGAQNPEFVQKPTIEAFNHYWDVAEGMIKLITFAPEEAEEGFIDHICSHGVVASAGHTDSGYDQIMNAAKEGLTNLTHFHNAMLPHHHRKPGAVTAGFVNDALKAELIVDGIHVAEASVYATYKIKGSDGIIGITDSMRAKGLPDGKYDLGGQDVFKEGIECRLASGALAGSVAEMDFVARNLHKFTGCTIEELIKMTSTNSAKQLGVYGRKGSIAIGKDADLVILDESLVIDTTICRGSVAYQR